MLDPLSEKILRLLHMLIKQNRPNAERTTKYENIIFMMLTRYDAKLVSKIFKETYKRAQVVIDQDDDDGGGDANVNAMAAAAGGSNAGQFSGKALSKWVKRLDLISYLNDRSENISK